MQTIGNLIIQDSHQKTIIDQGPSLWHMVINNKYGLLPNRWIHKHELNATLLNFKPWVYLSLGFMVLYCHSSKQQTSHFTGSSNPVSLEPWWRRSFNLGRFLLHLSVRFSSEMNRKVLAMHSFCLYSCKFIFLLLIFGR